MAMLLSRLLDGLVAVEAKDDRPILGLCADSRRVQPGHLFIARRGERFHALDHAPEAVGRGAVAILAAEGDAAGLRAALGVPVFVLEDLVPALGKLADRFHNEPSKAVRVIGVTGTNGKTSVTHFIAQALALAGQPSGLIGTLGMGPWDTLRPATHTTPDVLAVHAELARQRDAGVRYVAMEVSSHALDQGRVAGVRFRAAVFTNLTHDHLDYHGDLYAYARAKCRLFEERKPEAAILNMDDALGRELLEGLQGRMPLWAYGLGAQPWSAGGASVVEARGLRLDVAGIRIDLHTPLGKGVLTSPLMGEFNASNLLAALATLLELGMPLPDALVHLGRVAAPAGRMERFMAPGRPWVVIDYAHTPDALDKALRTLRRHAAGRLIVVFGCGGERDAAKRPRMGQVASSLADRVVLTDDNPRGEDGEAIIRAILAGMPEGGDVVIERDRRRAITLAVAQAAPEDIVLVAGKGHEDYQEIAGERRPFSDRAVVLELLGEGAC
ncbi:MAG: UDP-N-acetylmuramoyl-L-alanyl-D-glutamate--2,6-diaminopimelate ligase [Gammaproteobacteria bacterium]|nr:UDP-N-acetylmuramoyl-L-alanyl-D-glutamate--2,6-diaminopimelate ligase [Gammaproteobacteria bacterium]